MSWIVIFLVGDREMLCSSLIVKSIPVAGMLLVLIRYLSCHAGSMGSGLAWPFRRVRPKQAVTLASTR
jgi:hypothetical protein